MVDIILVRIDPVFFDKDPIHALQSAFENRANLINVCPVFIFVVDVRFVIWIWSDLEDHLFHVLRYRCKVCFINKAILLVYVNNIQII